MIRMRTYANICVYNIVLYYIILIALSFVMTPSHGEYCARVNSAGCIYIPF